MDFLSLTQAETSIENLDIHFNPDGWGPVAGEKLDIFGDVPYSHFDKKDKLGRHADFVISSYPSYNQKTTSYQKRRDDYFQNNDFSFKHDAAEDSTFQLVDTSKTQSKNKFGAGESTVRYNMFVLHVVPYFSLLHCYEQLATLLRDSSSAPTHNKTRTERPPTRTTATLALVAHLSNRTTINRLRVVTTTVAWIASRIACLPWRSAATGT